MELYIFQAMMGALMFGIGALFFKWNAHLRGDDNYFFTALYGVGGFCFFIDGFEEISALTNISYYISGAFVGLGAAGGNSFYAKGLHHGPAGLTAAFAKMNIVIVILLSSFYYGETLVLNEIIGIIVILIAMLIVNIKFGKNGKATSKIWFLLMLCSMTLIAFRNGGLKIVNEVGLTSMLVMWVAYSFCTMFFCTGLYINRNKPWTTDGSKIKVVLMGAMTGIISYVGLNFYITALKSGPGSVVVTIFSLDMIFVLIMSYIIFKERLNRNQMIGFVLSAVGFLLISLK